MARYQAAARDLAEESSELLAAAKSHIEVARDLIERGQIVITETYEWLDVQNKLQEKRAQILDRGEF